jgi:hypothetical protein
MLSTSPEYPIPAVEHHLGRFAGGDVPELGLFEIALHIEGVGVYQGHQGHPGGGVVADPGLQIGDVAVARGMDLGPGKGPSGLLQIGLGHLIGRLHRLGIEPGFIHRLGGDDGAGEALRRFASCSALSRSDLALARAALALSSAIR